MPIARGLQRARAAAKPFQRLDLPAQRFVLDHKALNQRVFLACAQTGQGKFAHEPFHTATTLRATKKRQPPEQLPTLPLYILYDEFGHSTIPNFVSTANTIRGYKVSLSIVLQSISQLRARYGEAYASSIQGGFNTYLTYAGADPETASFFERVIGNVRERQKRDLLQIDDHYREYSLISAAEIRMLHTKEALIVSGNKKPVKIETKAHFEQSRLKAMMRYAPPRAKPRPAPELEEVKLDLFP